MMFKPSHHVLVGLEIGTSKICAVVGQLTPEGGLNIVGVGQQRSRGVRKGEVVDPEMTEEDVRRALSQAEQMANLEIRSVFLGVTGAHLGSFNNRGRHHLPYGVGQITEADIRDTVRNARAFKLPAGHELVHLVRQHFLVDGQPSIVRPHGLSAAQLEVDVHIVHGLKSRLQTPVEVVESLQLEVEEIVFTGLASSLAVLSSQEKQLGALVIDLGAGTTEYVVYSEGIIKHTGVLAVGGDHVTNDLAYGLKLPLRQAEELKVAHGAALMTPEVRGRTLTLPSENGLDARPINVEHLHRVMSLRLEETLQIIADELEPAHLLEYLRAGVVLCGGGSRIPGIERLAERIFGLPVTLGRTQTISGLAATLDQPEFAAGIGLVRFGSFELMKPRRSRNLASRLARKLGGLFQTT
jgi:cell division protein FtsA